MATSLNNTLHRDNHYGDPSKDDDYQQFSENFQFQNSTSCSICNGYYGPNFGEPVCGTCHSFLYPTTPDEFPPITDISDSEDSGNDEPPYADRDNSNQAVPQNPGPANPPIRDVRQYEINSDDSSDEFSRPLNKNRLQPVPPRNLSEYIEELSETRQREKLIDINSLPVEVLLLIFSHLDDLSLWNVSEVCKQWNDILELHASPNIWKKYTKERWPLLQRFTTIPNWFKMYSELMSSCFCRTCLIQMALKTPVRGSLNVLRTNQLNMNITEFNFHITEGIDAVPLDMQQTHWQGYILGPPNSPYEGGKFFLYITLPRQYPLKAPNVRFLTKIIHPNVSRHGDVGIDTIQHNWTLALSMSKLLLGIQSLLTDPFTQTCMEPELGRMYEKQRKKFDALARMWTWKYAMIELMPPN